MDLEPLQSLTMSESERLLFGTFIEREFGIKMPANKKSLLEGRLGKRLRACGISSFRDYFNFVTKDQQGQDEFLTFIDLITTHETSFFRENKHFRYLAEVVLPRYAQTRISKPISVLSAACSTGEEVYSLAMVFHHYFEQTNQTGILWNIEGIDISERVVTIARRGVYTGDRIKNLGSSWLERYLMVSKDRSRNLFRIVPELRQSTKFSSGNLLEKGGLPNTHYDIIFCRNVMIYFDKDTQYKVLSSLVEHLLPRGLIFLGHSESFIFSELPLVAVSHAVFQRV